MKPIPAYNASVAVVKKPVIVSNVKTVDIGGVGFMLEIKRMHENIVRTPDIIGNDLACLLRTWCRAKMPPIVVEGYH